MLRQHLTVPVSWVCYSWCKRRKFSLLISQTSFPSPGWIKLVKPQASGAVRLVLSLLQSSGFFSSGMDGVGDRLTRIHTVKPVHLSGEEFIAFVDNHIGFTQN